MNIVHTKFGEKIDLEELEDTLCGVFPGRYSCVSAIVYFSSKAGYKDNLGPRIRVREGDPYASFKLDQTYPIFLNNLQNLEVSLRRPVLWDNLQKFVSAAYNTLIEQWDDLSYDTDSLYYLRKLEHDVNKLFN